MEVAKAAGLAGKSDCVILIGFADYSLLELAYGGRQRKSWTALNKTLTLVFGSDPMIVDLGVLSRYLSFPAGALSAQKSWRPPLFLSPP